MKNATLTAQRRTRLLPVPYVHGKISTQLAVIEVLTVVAFGQAEARVVE